MTLYTEPYYTDEDSKIMLFEGDVFEVTRMLTERGDWPAKVMTVTDPPYNVGMDYGPEQNDKREVGDYLEWSRAWYEAVPRPLVLTPGFVNFEMWVGYIDWPTAIVPWVKPNQSKKPFGSFQWFNVWEPVLMYGKPPANPRQDVIITPIGQQADVRRGGKNRHPCPKHLPFWLKLVGNVWKPGWVIYDPFLGSGTTALACKRLGIPFIGADLKRDYLDLSIERLQQEVMPMPEVEVDDSYSFKLSQQALAFDASHPIGVMPEAVEA